MLKRILVGILFLLAIGGTAYFSFLNAYRFLPDPEAIQQKLQADSGFAMEWRDSMYRVLPSPAFMTHKVSLSRQNLSFTAAEINWFFSTWNWIIHRSFMVNHVRAMNSLMNYSDADDEHPFSLQISIPSLDLKHFNKNSPWYFAARAAVNGNEYFPDFLDITGIFEPQTSNLDFQFSRDDAAFAGNIRLADMFSAKPIIASRLRLTAFKLSEPYFSGDLSARIEIEGEGINPANLGRSLFANGVFDLRSGQIEAGEWFSDAIGASLNLAQAKAVADYLVKDGKLGFDMMQGRFHTSANRLTLEQLNVKQNDYYLESEGSYGFAERDVEIRLKLILMEPISKKLVELSPELSSLLNESGRIVITALYRTFIPSKL